MTRAELDFILKNQDDTLALDASGWFYTVSVGGQRFYSTGRISNDEMPAADGIEENGVDWDAAYDLEWDLYRDAVEDLLDQINATVGDQPIGERIALVRQVNGLSQGGLGNLLGVSRQQVSRWELGDAAMSAERLIEIARAIGISPRELVPEK